MAKDKTVIEHTCKSLLRGLPFKEQVEIAHALMQELGNELADKPRQHTVADAAYFGFAVQALSQVNHEAVAKKYEGR